MQTRNAGTYYRTLNLELIGCTKVGNGFQQQWVQAKFKAAQVAALLLSSEAILSEMIAAEV